MLVKLIKQTNGIILTNGRRHLNFVSLQQLNKMESSSKQSLVIVSYYFPPFPRVGGRRWAKFVKYLVRNGWQVQVVAGDFPGSSSPWDKDVLSYKAQIHRVELKSLDVPFFKRKLPKNILEKFRWKFSQLFYERFTRPKYQGDFTDPSYLDGASFAEKVQAILSKDGNIQTVIISVGPFRYAIEILRLKKLFPNVRFLLDYRDLWLIPDALNHNQQQTLKAVISETNELADGFLAVNDNICAGLMSEFQKPGYTIPHGFDDDDFNNLSSVEAKSEKLNFVYGGDLYHGAEQKLELISQLLDELKSKGVDAVATFYIDKRKHPLKAWPHLEFKSPVSLERFLEIGSQADFLFIIRSDIFSNVFSTKVFELARLRRPIIVVDKKGALTDFIEENQLGFSLKQATEIEPLADKLIEQTKTKSLPKPYDLSEHSFVQITKLLETVMLKMENEV
jgi:glycosyltransferase involved in cell wall biosynthesis